MKAMLAGFLVMGSMVFFAGCLPKASNDLSVAAPLDEPSWIRDGEPIQFSGELWYPTREIERFMDNEVYQGGVYREVIFYIDKADVKPFERLYTRFAKGRYRAFERKRE